MVRMMSFIEAERDSVFEALYQWEAAAWWPEEIGVVCLVLEGPEAHAAGKQFRLIFKRPKFTVDVSVEQVIAGERIKHIFKNGPIRGHELWSVEERANGTRVDYELNAEPRSLWARLMWRLFWQKAYVRYVDAILRALKEYCEQKEILAASD